MVSLRPVGGHAALRRAAATEGARLLALSAWRLAPRGDTNSREALARALAAPLVVFTSPAAARCASGLLPLQVPAGAQWIAVGSGTRQALRRAGVAAVAPRRMDTEGLLALPELQRVDGRDIGLVTAPGGRGELSPELARRGAQVLRADVYERLPAKLSARAIAALQRLEGPAWLALSSGEALETILQGLPAHARPALLRADVVAASDRLAASARGHGFRRTVVAASARPRDLVAAAAAAHPLA